MDANMDPFLRIVNYTSVLRQRAVAMSLPAPLTGMVVGPAEHDLCSWLHPYFDINAWMARGLRDAGLFLRETNKGPSGLADSLLHEAETYYSDVIASVEGSLIKVNTTSSTSLSRKGSTPTNYLPLWPVA